MKPGPGARRPDERGQVSVEYAFVAAIFLAVAVVVLTVFNQSGLGVWVDAVNRAVLVSVDDLSGVRAIGRELADR